MIEQGKNVSLLYTLTVQGEIIDQSSRENPFVYKHGAGQIIAGLEKALEGLSVGDKKEVLIAPDDGYGVRDPKAIFEIPKDQIDTDDIEIGTILTLTDEKGQKFEGGVIEINEDSIKVDFNHPLAGKELSFEIEVIDITEE